MQKLAKSLSWLVLSLFIGLGVAYATSPLPATVKNNVNQADKYDGKELYRAQFIHF